MIVEDAGGVEKVSRGVACWALDSSTCQGVEVLEI